MKFSLFVIALAVSISLLGCTKKKGTPGDSTVRAQHRGGIKPEIFRFSWNDGTRWLKVEALSDDILHFETYESRGAGHENRGPARDPIWASPMIDLENYSQFTGSRSFKRIAINGEPGVETDEIRAIFSSDLRNVRMHDKIRGVDLTTLGTEKLNEAIKTLHIEKLGMKNVYGVGNLFVDASSADGDWVNRQWNARGHGNFRFGQDFGDSFAEGGPSSSQFPMIYVLGDKLASGAFANYGLLLDQPYKTSWNFQDTANGSRVGWTASQWGDQMRWYFMTGPNLKNLRQDYMKLVGKQPLPPKTVFGHWTSKFGYTSWEDIERDVTSLRGNDFPLEGVALDIQWFNGSFGQPSSHRMGTLQFDERDGKFPNPAARIKQLYDRFGIHVIPIEESYVDSKSGYGDFQAMTNHEYRRNTVGFNHFSGEPYNACYLARTSFDFRNGSWGPTFVTKDYHQARDENDAPTEPWWGTGGMIDWSNPNGRAFWHQLKRHSLSKMGIVTHWLDLGEPEMYYEGSLYHGLPGIQKIDHGSIHNLYNLFWAMGISEGYSRAENKNELTRTYGQFHGKAYDAPPRHFTMSRAGTIGSHRYGGMWSGDTFSNMQNLRAHLGTQKDMSLLGVDLYSSDTGGFFHGGRGERDLQDREIVTQWAATSSLLDNPMRPHGWALTGERFALDARGDLDSNRANVRRRYELTPYVYSLAHRAYLNGEPMYPPLVYHFQDDMNARRIGNVKMIGESLLFGVSATEGERQRRVYLPRGTWIDYENNRFYTSEGGESDFIPLYRRERVPEAERRVRPERHFFMVPVFAKAGAIIPKMYVDQHTVNLLGRRRDNATRDELIVRVFASSDRTTFTLYEDDGVTTAYQQGKVQTTELSQKLDGNVATVTIEASRGTYLNAPQTRESIAELVVNNRNVERVELNGTGCGTFPEFMGGRGDCWFAQDGNLIKSGSRKIGVATVKTFVFRLR